MKKRSPSPFMKKVWELALSIPSGRVTTYGLLTISAGGHPMMAQMITSILGRCPEVDKIPFHRIVYSGGRVWMSPKYRKTRLKLYKEEGIILDKKDRIVDFEKHLFTFD